MLKIIIFTLLIVGYASTTLLISVTFGQVIVALSIMLLMTIWLSLNRHIKFDILILILILVSLSIVALALKVSLISITLLLLLATMFYYEGDKVNKFALKFYLRLNLCLFLIVVFFYFLTGFNEEYDMTMWRIDEVIERSALGFSQPNQAMMLWMSIIISILAFSNKKNAKKLSMFVLVTSLVVYAFTLSRTSTLIIVLICGYIFLFSRTLNEPVKKSYRFLLAVFPIICLIISFILVLTPYNVIFNELLSGRLALYQSFYNEFGLTLLGSSELEDAMFDNAYLQALLAKGIMFTCLLMFTFFLLIIRLRHLEKLDAILILAYFICGMAETMFFKFEILILILMLMFRNNNKKIEIYQES